MRILITRPKVREAALKQRLESEGHIVSSFPLFNIMAATETDLQPLSGLKAGDTLIFVSRFAVHTLETNNIHIPEGCVLMAVGQITGNALAKAYPKHQVIYPEDADSEHLIEKIDLSQVGGKRFFICRGDYGRMLIQDTLSAHKAEVVEVTCYRRELLSEGFDQVLSEMQASSFDVIVVTSTEALRHFIMLMGEHMSLLKDTCVTVMGERMAKLAEAHHLKTISAQQFLG